MRPLKWVIVDDGSCDRTLTIAREAARREPWIEVVSRKDRGFRQSGIGVVESFYDGFSRVKDLPWAFVVKMDGDIRLSPKYFEEMISHLERDTELGICSGDIYFEENGVLALDSPGDPEFHVRGAAKIYKRKCWEKIGGIARVTGFDCIDNVQARRLGWKTRRFPEPKVIHLRRTGDANGVWRNSLKDGIGANAIGYHPLFLLVKCLRRILMGGSLLVALGQLCGFFRGYFANIKRIEDPELVRYLRRQQLNRLLGRETIWR